jgi:hypothetical protein
VSSIEAGVLKYQFDETGLSGACRNIIPDPVLGDFVLFQGQFECRDHSSYRIGAYGFELLLSHFDEQLGGTPFTLLKGACDLQEATQTSGRHETLFMGSEMNPGASTQGTLVLSR